MNEPRQRSLTLLSRTQTLMNAAVVVVILAVYGINSSLLIDVGASITNVIIGAASVVYYLTIHQVLGRTRLALSTLTLTILTAINFVFMIATTGGLDSPYYSLWLLAIVVAGIFGTRETTVVLAMTLIYYIHELSMQNFRGPYVRDHLVQLAITLVAGALAQWVHLRAQKASIQRNQLENLSGQLTEEQLKAQALMTSIGEGVLVINAQRQIKLFNKAAQTLTGWDEESAQGIDYNLVLQLHDTEDKELTAENDPFTEALSTHDQIVRTNLTMTTRSGRKVALNLSISPITTAEGATNGAIALFRDITREKALERQKDEFVSTASHEMRTPVAAIEGYISLAMNQNVATIDDRARGYLVKAHDAIAHLGELFRDLLSVAKAEEGSLNAKVEAIDLAQLLQSVVEDMQFSAQKKGLSLVYQVSSSSGKAIAPITYVAANPERLREVVMNLIDNALKFTSQGGVTIALATSDKEAEVAVSDTGVGIAAEDIPHLFQKFYRIDNSATRTIGGTGLGLYLCRTVIELFNGRIWVTSKQNEGSTFHFSLPRLETAEVERLKQAAADTTAPQSAPGPSTAPTQLAPAAPRTGSVITPQPLAGPAITTAPIAMPVPGEQSLESDPPYRVQ